MNLVYVRVLIQKKLYKNALEYMKNINQSDIKANATKIHYYKALCYANIKSYQKALDFFDFVLYSKLGFIYTYQCKMIKGYIYTMMKKLRQAELEFLDLINMGYESTRVYAAVGHVVYVQGKINQAVHFIQKALNLDSSNITALNSMSYILAENNVKLDVALSFIQRVINKQPNNPAYLDTYGLILYRLGKFKDARKVLDHAYKISQDPLILKHINVVIQKRRQ